MCAGVSLVYWPLQTIMCAKLVRVSREQKYIVRKYQAKNILSRGAGNKRQNVHHINLGLRVGAKILFDLK